MFWGDFLCYKLLQNKSSEIRISQKVDVSIDYVSWYLLICKRLYVPASERASERRTSADGDGFMAAHSTIIKPCMAVCVCVSSSIGHADTLSCSLRTCIVCVWVHSLCRYLLCRTNKARSHSRWRHLTISALTCKQVIFPSVSLSLFTSLCLSLNRQIENEWAPTKVNYSSPGDVVLNNAISF